MNKVRFHTIDQPDSTTQNSTDLNIIYHNHHIIPKYMGGTDDPDNLISLTIEEHAEAHRILFEQHGNWQDEVAWKGLAGLIGRDEILKKTFGHLKGKKRPREIVNKIANTQRGSKRSDKAKENMKAGNKYRDNTNIGKYERDAQHRQIMSDAKRGTKVSDETKQKISNSIKGRKRSDSTRAKMKEAAIRREQNKRNNF